MLDCRRSHFDNAIIVMSVRSVPSIVKHYFVHAPNCCNESTPSSQWAGSEYLQLSLKSYHCMHSKIGSMQPGVLILQLFAFTQA